MFCKSKGHDSQGVCENSMKFSMKIMKVLLHEVELKKTNTQNFNLLDCGEQKGKRKTRKK